MLAASKGKSEVVQYLIRIGADVTLKGEDGMTALHMAAKFGHLNICRIILSECKVPRTLVGKHYYMFYKTIDCKAKKLWTVSVSYAKSKEDQKIIIK